MFIVHTVASAPVSDACLSNKQRFSHVFFFTLNHHIHCLLSPLVLWIELISTLLLFLVNMPLYRVSVCCHSAQVAALNSSLAHIIFNNKKRCTCTGFCQWQSVTACVFVWEVCILKCVCALCVSACLKLADSVFLSSIPLLVWQSHLHPSIYTATSTQIYTHKAWRI